MSASSTPSERRRFQRIAFSAEVEIQQDEMRWSATLKDISFKGALVATPVDWELAQSKAPFVLNIRIDEETHIRFVATLKHTEADQLGFHCENMDLDSASYLRRLVELNLGDPALLERELSLLVAS